jgi:hypothetical protein
LLDCCQEPLGEEEGTKPNLFRNTLVSPSIEELISLIELSDPCADRFVGQEVELFPFIWKLILNKFLAYFSHISAIADLIIEEAFDFGEVVTNASQ